MTPTSIEKTKMRGGMKKRRKWIGRVKEFSRFAFVAQEEIVDVVLGVYDSITTTAQRHYLGSHNIKSSTLKT